MTRTMTKKKMEMESITIMTSAISFLGGFPDTHLIKITWKEYLKNLVTLEKTYLSFFSFSSDYKILLIKCYLVE